MRAFLVVPPSQASLPDSVPWGLDRIVLACAAEVPPAAFGRPLLLPVADGVREVARLGARLAVHEAETGLDDGVTRIVAMIASARGVLALPSLAGAGARLAGIAWDADALAAGIGAPSCRDRAGRLIAPLLQVRCLVRMTAAAAGVAAIDTACRAQGALVDDIDGARGDGFCGKIAAGPDQVPVIAAAARTGGPMGPPPADA